MNDVDQVTALTVSFVVTLPLLIYTMVRLEDTIAEPPMHLGRRILTFVFHAWARRR